MEIHTIINNMIYYYKVLEFLSGTTASQIARNIYSKFGSRVTAQKTVSSWFPKLRADKSATLSPRVKGQ